MKRILCTLAVAILFATSALAKIIRVPADQPTIQAAINAAAKGDTVLVADGTYYENINFKGKAITVASHFLMDADTSHISNTIIDGSKPTNPDSGSVVFFVSGEDTTSVLYGFTITGGTGTETTEMANNILTPCRAGGGIFCNNGFAKIVHNKIINNAAISNDKEVIGGGLIALPFGSNAWLVLRDNQISRNMIKTTAGAAVGGGLEIGCNGILLNNLISNNMIVHNSTGNEQAGGGGLDCITYSSDLRTFIAEFNRITYNSVTSSSNNTGVTAFSGGVSISGKYQGRLSKNEVSYNEVWVNSNKNGVGVGMLIERVAESFVIEGNFIRENAVKRGNGYGGGVNIASTASPAVINNIITGNSATNGGGLIAVNSTVKLINNTVVNNKATTGGGIYLTGSSTAYLMNTILWNNQAPTHAAIHIESGTVQAAYCDIQGGWSGTGNINADPVFADNLFRLAEASPCIGKGMTSYNFGAVTLQAPATDFFGNSRPNPTGSRPDLGAVEHSRAFPKQPHLVEVPKDYPTIQAAINAAAKGDTVLVADGTYYENINFKGKAITVASHFLMDADTSHISNTIIDGSKPSDPNKGSVVSFVSGEDTTSVIYGFTITGGTGTLYDADTKAGGGIYCKSSGPRISHNKIVRNTVNHIKGCDGGGIGFWPREDNAAAPYLIIENNMIESNSIMSPDGERNIQGGGIYITKGRISGNTIRFNSVSGQPRFAGGGGIAVGCEDTATRTLVVISGNTIAHNQAITPGYYGGWGGGIDVVFCNVQIFDNLISHNTVGGSGGWGAAIRLWRSKEISLIKDNTISSNTVTAEGGGGGIELVETQGVSIIENRLESNDGAILGGGLDIYGSAGTIISGNEFIGNRADFVGGGLNIEESNNSAITGNFFKANQAKYGGGIRSSAGNYAITNNILVENEAQWGGGIACRNYRLENNVTRIINNTITANVADTAGAIASGYGKVVLMNTICWGNTAKHGPEIEIWSGTLNVAHSDVRFGANGIVIDSVATVNWLAGNIDANPLLVADSLSNGSPCINAGINAFDFGNGNICTCPDKDINGRARPFPGTKPDMGAWESMDKITGIVSESGSLIPTSYALEQNHPNPFNPCTTIEFALPKASFLTLKIYDLLGNEVATLVAEKLPAGRHQRVWEAKGLASGVYVYRLQAGEFVQTKKLILLR